MKNYFSEWVACGLCILIAILFPMATGMPASGLSYYAMLLFFAVLVLGFFFLSIAKLYINKINIALSGQILHWSLPEGSSPAHRLPHTALCAAGAVIISAILGLFSQGGWIAALLTGLFIGAASYAFWGWANKRIAEKRRGLADFVLGHRSLVLKGKITVLDGMRNAVYETAYENAQLKLGLKKGRSLLQLSVPVPADQESAVTAFLEDLQRHFALQEEEETDGEE